MADVPLTFDQAFDAAYQSAAFVVYKEQTVDLFEGHKEPFKAFVQEYISKHQEFVLAAGAHRAKTRSDLVIDGPIHALWKDANTTDWKLTPTGLGTFDNVFPESATKIRFDEDPDHWVYFVGFAEIGSANNINRVFFADLNGTPYSYQSLILSSRIGEIKIYRLNPAIMLRARGTIRIDIEFETTSPAEIIPLALHILPHEIASTADVSGFVTTV